MSAGSSITKFSISSEFSPVPDEYSIRFSLQLEDKSPSGSLEENSSNASPRSLNDYGLADGVEELVKKLRHIKVENDVFYRFLEKNAPEPTKELELKRVRRTSCSSRALSLFSKPRGRSSLILVTGQPLTEKQVKINITQKSDLVMRDLEEIQEHIGKVKKKTHKIKSKLVAEIEEIDSRKEELDNSIESFEEFKQYHDQIPFEKFVRFMEEWSKRSRLTADKIRLRYSSLKVQYHKLSATLAYKRLIGENLQSIDFEQLRIENFHLVEKVDQKHMLLIEMKRMTGAGNLKLSQHKSFLHQRIAEKESILDKIKQIERDITKSDNDLVRSYAELDEVKDEYFKVQAKYSRYVPPNLMDYIRKKAEVDGLRKDLKMWNRRKSIREIALDVEIKKMQKLLRCTETHSCWFE